MRIVNYEVKRAPVIGALFICLLLLVASTYVTDAEPLVRVKQVIDGDTIILQNNDKVRFLGVNTPELGHGKFRDEPLANTARQFVTRKIEGREVLLENERSQKDKYGRRLAQVHTLEGEDIQVGLLERGLGFVVAVGEGGFDYVERYISAETIARDANKGVWGNEHYAPISAKVAVDTRQRGYKRVRGTVKRVSRSRNNQTLHLEGDFRILIAHENWRQYFKGDAQRFVGQSVAARGWIFKSHGVTGMKIYYPAMLETTTPIEH
jgi:endonuclease YncB( thermonuclease family)